MLIDLKSNSHNSISIYDKISSSTPAGLLHLFRVLLRPDLTLWEGVLWKQLTMRDDGIEKCISENFEFYSILILNF